MKLARNGYCIQGELKKTGSGRGMLKGTRMNFLMVLTYFISQKPFAKSIEFLVRKRTFLRAKGNPDLAYLFPKETHKGDDKFGKALTIKVLAEKHGTERGFTLCSPTALAENVLAILKIGLEAQLCIQHDMQSRNGGYLLSCAHTINTHTNVNRDKHTHNLTDRRCTVYRHLTYVVQKLSRTFSLCGL